MTRLRGEISSIHGKIVTIRLRSGKTGPLTGFPVLLDDVPAGLAEAVRRPSGAGTEFRFALPGYRIAATLDIRDPLSGRSLFGRPFNLSGHYRLAIEELVLNGVMVKGRFNIAAELDEFLHVELLEDGTRLSDAYARRSGPYGDAFRYEFALPLRTLPALHRGYALSVRIAGATPPDGTRLEVTHEQTGYAGYVESIAEGRLSGWAANLRDPAERVRLDLLLGDKVVASARANRYRKDVSEVGFGDGKVGFRFAIPELADAGRAEPLGVVLKGTRTHLVNSPMLARPPAQLLGFFDGLQGRIAVGWACDIERPDHALEVEIVCEGRVIGVDTARHYRGDVETAGWANAKCGFRVDLGQEFRACLGKQISARLRGPGIELGGSPYTVRENPNLRRFLERSSGLEPAVLARLKRRLNNKAGGYGISIVMPVYNTPKLWLVEALDSVRGQWCDNWELICVDDCSTEPHVREILNAYAVSDPRIRIVSSAENAGIAGAANLGITEARLDYVSFLDHDDFLEPDAVWHLTRGIRQTGAELLYSDEVLTHEALDSILEVRARPAFSYDYYLSHPYFVHMVCVKTSLARRIGGWNEAMRISADIDFVLRALEVAGSVAHVPAVLYRWRTHDKSAGHAKQAEVMAATKAAIRRHLDRCGIDAAVSDGAWFNQFRMDWPDDPASRVLIVIPTRDKVDLLRNCIESIERTAAGARYRLVVVDHESNEPESRRYFASLAGRHIVMPYKGPFNFARINNTAVREHGGGADYVLFLNNDIEAIEPGWLQRMRSLARRPDVGAVGPLLLYGDRRVQHAGVIIGFNNAAEHAMKFQEAYIENGTRRNLGYNCSLSSVRDFSAVTAACMMLRREVFDRVGGFDETFAIGFNDTDLCLRLREQGLKILYDGHTILLHHESATRSETKQVLHPDDDRRLRERWQRYFSEGDPFYNPNLDHDSSDHSLREDGKCRQTAPARLTRIALGPSSRAASVERPSAESAQVVAGAGATPRLRRGKSVATVASRSA